MIIRKIERGTIGVKLKEYFDSEIFQYVYHIIISIILGLFAGAGAILFHVLLHKMKDVFNPNYYSELIGLKESSVIFIPIIGGIIVATMTKIFKKYSTGGGVHGVIKSIIIHDGHLSFRSTIFHLFAPIISIGSGAPLGPEGPAARLGSGIGSTLAKMFNMNSRDVKMYTAAGAGAAISAIFNAPIAGMFFGIEVILLNDLKNQSLSALVISSVVADILSRAFLGDVPIFTIPNYHSGTVGEFPAYLILGILCGLVSVLFFVVMKKTDVIINKKFAIENEFLKLVPVTIIFGFVLYFFFDLFGLGYGTISNIFAGHFGLSTLIILVSLKIIFVALFLNSGAYGGTFAPSLSVGAMVGYIFALSMNLIFGMSLDPVTFSLVAMGGVLSGIASIPITSVLLVFEITNDYKFILPLMFVSVISYLVTLYYNKASVHIMELLEEGIDVSKRGETDLLGKIEVKSLMKHRLYKVSYKMPFRKLIDSVMDSKTGDVIVVDDEDKLLGVITLKDTREALISNELVDLLIAGDIISRSPIVVVDEKVSSAMEKIEKYDLENIPVVASENNMEIVGVLRSQDIILAYNNQLRKWETDQFLMDYGKNV